MGNISLTLRPYPLLPCFFGYHTVCFIKDALRTMNQIAASESRVELPRRIALEPSIHKIIEIFPANEQNLAPMARIIIARNPIEKTSYQAKRTSCHYLLQKLLRSISAIHKDYWELNYSSSGAPALISGESLNLSISMARSGDWMAVGVSYRAGIGVDIECIKPRTNISAKADFLNWNIDVTDIQDFYAKWTLWEASAKCVSGSVFMCNNNGFNALSNVSTRNRVGRSQQWSGLHDCLDEKLFFAVVLQCQNNTDLGYQVLCPERLVPWPIAVNQCT